MVSPERQKLIVQFYGVNKWYGDYAALRNIELTVSQGEIVIVCGPSGSGKSTLIRCVNGLEKYQEGKIVVNGTDVGVTRSGDDKVRCETGMVFQNFNLFPHMTALENCMLAPKSVLKISTAEAQERAEKFLTKVGMSHKMDHYPSQLSGGQQQRVAIARALCMSPLVLLLDEPTSALDPEMVKEVLDVLLSLAESGITMMCVTHEMDFARKAADRVVFMDQGEIVEINTPDVFFTCPASERARQFVGQISH
ncbi:amino acid ABC transporter ATP-binding protein [Pantoea cypripedii]|uniref:Glutamine ABC transporter ATP-binding protein n=1 Tax=Pantoea cypripedii TaxID=55209 RepID=A0A6B9G980_PANCY|nr:amino acid ABC transporter ATP-binding protein [Pantoea cypripedii]QGY33062.1 glutamine ABC transporter ATP-binding protein [Pantoea cypripedii]